jgi:hypothetical protein
VALHDPAHRQRRRLAGPQRPARHDGRELPHHLLLHLSPRAPERVSCRSRSGSGSGSFLRNILCHRRRRGLFRLGGGGARSRGGLLGRRHGDGGGRGHELRGLRRGVVPQRGLEVLDHGHDERAHWAGHDLGREVEDVVGDAGADEELRDLVAEVVAVVGEEAVRLRRVARRDGAEVVLEHLAREVRDAQLHHPQRPPVRRRARRRRLDPTAEEVLVPVHHHARVPVGSIQERSETPAPGLRSEGRERGSGGLTRWPRWACRGRRWRAAARGRCSGRTR